MGSIMSQESTKPALFTEEGEFTLDDFNHNQSIVTNDDVRKTYPKSHLNTARGSTRYGSNNRHCTMPDIEESPSVNLSQRNGNEMKIFSQTQGCSIYSQSVNHNKFDEYSSPDHIMLNPRLHVVPKFVINDRKTSISMAVKNRKMAVGIRKPTASTMQDSLSTTYGGGNDQDNVSRKSYIKS